MTLFGNLYGREELKGPFLLFLGVEVIIQRIVLPYGHRITSSLPGDSTSSYGHNIFFLLVIYTAMSVCPRKAGSSQKGPLFCAFTSLALLLF